MNSKKIFSGLLLASLAHCSLSLASNTLQNAGFETPFVGQGYGYLDHANDLSYGWTFSGHSGVAGNNSVFNVMGATDNQAAFLQANGAVSSISQSFDFIGSQFSLTFLAEARAGYGANPITVSVDSNILNFSNITSLTPNSDTVFNTYRTDPIALMAGLHTLTFTGSGSASDITSFIDQVSINSDASANVPEPATTALLGLGLGLLGFSASRRKSAKK